MPRPVDASISFPAGHVSLHPTLGSPQNDLFILATHRTSYYGFRRQQMHQGQALSCMFWTMLLYALTTYRSPWTRWIRYRTTSGPETLPESRWTCWWSSVILLLRRWWCTIRTIWLCEWTCIGEIRCRRPIRCRRRVRRLLAWRLVHCTLSRWVGCRTSSETRCTA